MGHTATVNHWRDKVAELEAELRVAKSNITTALLDRMRYRKDRPLPSSVHIEPAEMTSRGQIFEVWYLGRAVGNIRTVKTFRGYGDEWRAHGASGQVVSYAEQNDAIWAQLDHAGVSLEIEEDEYADARAERDKTERDRGV